MTDVIIIGAGTAGITAAIYVRRAGKSVSVFEALSYGGQIINTPDIENYPAAFHISGFDYATKLYEQAKSLGAEFVFSKVTGIIDKEDHKEVVTSKGVFSARALIIASGSRNRKLGVAEEDRFVGRGVSYCATCDGAFYKGKTVAVVGGGNTAVEDALYLSDLAQKVYLIHRRDQFRADEASVSLLRTKENVEFVLDSIVSGLTGDKRLEGVTAVRKDGTVRELSVDGLFVAVGRVPESGLVSEIVKLDESGYISAGEDCATSVRGIFAAGDVRTKTVRQLVTAASDGAVAATGALKYISASEKEWKNTQ